MFQKILIQVTHPNGDAASFTATSLKVLDTLVDKIKRQEAVYHLQLPAEEFFDEWFEVTQDFGDKVSGMDLADMFKTWRISKGYDKNQPSSGRSYLYRHVRSLNGVIETLPNNRLMFHGIRLRKPFMQVICIDDGEDELI